MAKNSEKKRPVWTKIYFPVKVAVFEFRNDDGRSAFSVSLSRSFQRSEGAGWETTTFLLAQDLLAAAKLLSEAHSFVQARLEKAYRGRRQQDSDIEVTAADRPF
jgi:hypothetical protein